jgi:hypothetical protein
MSKTKRLTPHVTIDRETSFVNVHGILDSHDHSPSPLDVTDLVVFVGLIVATLKELVLRWGASLLLFRKQIGHYPISNSLIYDLNH